jgi:hypothetical protein
MRVTYANMPVVPLRGVAGAIQLVVMRYVHLRVRVFVCVVHHLVHQRRSIYPTFWSNAASNACIAADN